MHSLGLRLCPVCPITLSDYPSEEANAGIVWRLQMKWGGAQKNEMPHRIQLEWGWTLSDDPKPAAESSANGRTRAE